MLVVSPIVPDDTVLKNIEFVVKPVSQIHSNVSSVNFTSEPTKKSVKAKEQPKAKQKQGSGAKRMLAKR